MLCTDIQGWLNFYPIQLLLVLTKPLRLSIAWVFTKSSRTVFTQTAGLFLVISLYCVVMSFILNTINGSRLNEFIVCLPPVIFMWILFLFSIFIRISDLKDDPDNADVVQRVRLITAVVFLFGLMTIVASAVLMGVFLRNAHINEKFKAKIESGGNSWPKSIWDLISMKWYRRVQEVATTENLDTISPVWLCVSTIMLYLSMCLLFIGRLIPPSFLERFAMIMCCICFKGDRRGYGEVPEED